MLQRLDLHGGQHLSYVEHGDGPDVLVLLHGGGLDHRMWAPQIGAFPGWRVLAPDARGHGGSSTPDRPYRLVDDVVALLDAIDVPRAVVAGVSMGAGTAVDLAVERPDRLRGLVVSGSGTSEPDFRDPWVLEVFEAWARAVERRDPEAWIEAFARFVPGPHRRADQVDPDVRAANDAMVRSTLTTHVLPTIAAGGMPVRPSPVERVNERRRDISVPVLAIIGGDDAGDHIRLARELLAHVADGREVVVPTTGHYPNLERPALFNAALEEHLTAIRERRGQDDVAIGSLGAAP